MEIQPKSWTAFTAEFLSLYAAPMRAKNTLDMMRRTLALLPPLGVTSTADVTAPMVAKLIASRPTGESGHTTLGLLSYLRAAANYAEASGYLRVSPFKARGIRRWVRVPRDTKRRHHSKTEIAAVLALMKWDCEEKAGWPQWRARRTLCLTTLVACTGLRRNEALFAELADCDLDAHLFHVRPHTNRLKTEASSATIALPNMAVEAMREWLPHRLERPPGWTWALNARSNRPDSVPWLFPNARGSGPWTSGGPGQAPIHRLQAIGERVGVHGLTWLSLRHSFAVHAMAAGISGPLIARAMRHTSTRTSEQFYFHDDPDNLRAAFDGFTF